MRKCPQSFLKPGKIPNGCGTASLGSDLSPLQAFGNNNNHNKKSGSGGQLGKLAFNENKVIISFKAV